MAIATTESDNPAVIIGNVNPEYPECNFHHDSEIIVDIDASVHEWSNYFKCGYKGIFEKLKLKATKSLFILMDGTVPLVFITSFILLGRWFVVECSFCLLFSTRNNGC